METMETSILPRVSCNFEGCRCTFVDVHRLQIHIRRYHAIHPRDLWPQRPRRRKSDTQRLFNKRPRSLEERPNKCKVNVIDERERNSDSQQQRETACDLPSSESKSRFKFHVEVVDDETRPLFTRFWIRRVVDPHDIFSIDNESTTNFRGFGMDDLCFSEPHEAEVESWTSFTSVE